jgi:hypothetical protein
MTEKETAWLAFREGWNIKGATGSMSDVDERTARRHFESWWQNNHHE